MKLSTEYEMLMANGHFDLSGGNDPGKCTGMATKWSEDGGLFARSRTTRTLTFGTRRSTMS